MGGATSRLNAGDSSVLFQSTLPVGGATCAEDLANNYAHNISIHAPRGGSDAKLAESMSKRKNFNPRSPWGERPGIGMTYFQQHDISIHAPRGGSDCSYKVKETLNIYFNPRSPWGERLVACLVAVLEVLFQSTLPVGGATTPSSGSTQAG